MSPKHGPVLLFDKVPNRTMIEIHAGNYTRQVEGCILVGSAITFLDGDGTPDVTNSRYTLSQLLSAFQEDEVEVKISRTRRAS